MAEKEILEKLAQFMKDNPAFKDVMEKICKSQEVFSNDTKNGQNFSNQLVNSLGNACGQVAIAYMRWAAKTISQHIGKGNGER
ncbi:MAG: hypothetical protein LUB59_04860 [Candidatus Gastranaerophilales bacterium]|nr:hypothetical protein [Candidatus Gastranaerophilales bacterium]